MAPGVHPDAETREDLGRLAAHRTPVDRPESATRRMADEDVLGDRQVREESRLLVDYGDAQRPGLGRTLQRDLLTVEQQRAGVGLMDAGQDLDERALAGAVLADQPMDLARPQLERDVVERLGRVEPLRDADERRAARRARRAPRSSSVDRRGRVDARRAIATGREVHLDAASDAGP